MGDDGKPLLLQCLKWADKLPNEDLREVLEHLHFTLKMRLKDASLRAALLLRSGDWVENPRDVRKLPAGLRGHITEIRRGRIDGHLPDYGHLTVPAPIDGPHGPGAQLPVNEVATKFFANQHV